MTTLTILYKNGKETKYNRITSWDIGDKLVKMRCGDGIKDNWYYVNIDSIEDIKREFNPS